MGQCAATWEEDLMSAEENKALVRQHIDVVWNQRNIAALELDLLPHRLNLPPLPLAAADQVANIHEWLGSEPPPCVRYLVRFQTR
jgi:hypothetical protein